MTRRRRRILRWSSIATLLAFAFVTCFAFGCFAGPRRAATLPPLAETSPRLIHVVGWNGPLAGDRAFLLALRDGGCPHAMETFDWTDGHNGLAALWHAQRAIEPATRLAARIETLSQESTRPIDLTADSSGCGVLRAALARLPADVRVRTVFLSSPALSRGYDLAPALAHIDDRLITFRSDRDWLILGLGTTLFGTVDCRHASAAGRYGFNASDPKLVQIDYDPAWSKRFGNSGGHAASLGANFARGYVAALLSSSR